jgi:hypothetical protein
MTTALEPVKGEPLSDEERGIIYAIWLAHSKDPRAVAHVTGYTQEQVMQALVYSVGVVRPVSEIGTGRTPGEYYAQRGEIMDLIRGKLEGILDKMVDQIEQRIPHMNNEEAIKAFGLVFDKVMLLRNKPTAIIKAQEGVSDAARLDRALEILEHARQRRLMAVSDGGGESGVSAARSTPN